MHYPKPFRLETEEPPRRLESEYPKPETRAPIESPRRLESKDVMSRAGSSNDGQTRSSNPTLEPNPEARARLMREPDDIGMEPYYTLDYITMAEIDRCIEMSTDHCEHKPFINSSHINYMRWVGLPELLDDPPIGRNLQDTLHLWHVMKDPINRMKWRIASDGVEEMF